MVTVNYTDERGIPRRAQVPSGTPEDQYHEGIHIDLYDELDARLFSQTPIGFRRRLYTLLHDKGLIEPIDFLQNGARDRFRAAFLLAVKTDALDAERIAKEVLKHERTSDY